MGSRYNRKHAGIGFVAMLLLVCEMASLVLLFSRVVGFTEARPYEMVITGDVLTTEMEIFHASYDETGKMTVQSQNSEDHVIAPGTSEDFKFNVYNTVGSTVCYFLYIEAVVEGLEDTELTLPVQVSAQNDYTNAWIVGSGGAMVSVHTIPPENQVDEGELGAGRYIPYTLTWEWPFERYDENGNIQDVYDTTLGNIAAWDRDISLTLIVRVLAEYDEAVEPSASPKPTGGPKPTVTPSPAPGVPGRPHTGDDTNLGLLCAMAVGSLLGLFLLFLFTRRRDKNTRQES